MIRAFLVGVLLAVGFTTTADAALANRTYTVVPTPAGNLDLRYLDGDDGTPAIPLTWAFLTDHANEVEGTAASYALCASLTQPGSPNATVSITPAVSGWSVINQTATNCTLAYSGTGTSAPTAVVARADRSGTISDSLPFNLGANAPDTNTCISGFTCVAFSGATCGFTDVSGDQQIVHSGPGACATYKTFASEQNRHFAIEIKSGATFNTNNFSGGGAFLMEGTNWETDYLSQMWWPKQGVPRLRSNDNGTALGQNCAGSPVLGHYLRILYDASLDDQSGWESNDNTTYTQCGVSVDDGAITSGIYGVYVQGSTDTTNSTTMTFDVVTDSTTLPGGTPSPPNPPAGPFISNLAGGPDWPSGIGQAASGPATGSANFAAWAGRESDVYAAWCSQQNHATWNQIRAGTCASSTQVQDALDSIPPNRTIVFAWPFIPQEVTNRHCVNNAMWDDAAAGNFDDEWADMASGLRAHLQANGRPPDDPNIVMRLNWEMSGTWYPWAVCAKHTQFKTAWQKVVTALRAEIPGILIAFEPARTMLKCSQSSVCSPSVALTTWAPDPAYIDFYGRSLHNEDSDNLSTTAQFITLHVNSSSSVIGLDAIYNLAVANGKKVSFSEWGTPQLDATSCGADHQPTSDASSSAFLEGSYDWMSPKAATMGYETYLSTSCQSFWWPTSRQDNSPALLYDSLWNN